MNQPGIDIGAKFELYRLIDELASGGTAILLVSSELPEILALSDRILVMNSGSIVTELSHAEASEETIFFLMLRGLPTVEKKGTLNYEKICVIENEPHG